MRLGFSGCAWKRDLWQCRVNRERLERLIVVPEAVRHEARELRLVRELRVAGGADGIGGVGRPERLASLGRSKTRGVIGEAKRVVPDEGVGEVVEPRAGVRDPQQVAPLHPLGPDGDIIRPRVVGQCHLDVVREAERAAPRQLATVTRGRERRFHVECGRRRRQHTERSNVAPLHEIELGSDRDICRQGRAFGLDVGLRDVVQEQRAS